MTITCTTRRPVKSTRRTARPASTFGVGLEAPTIEPTEPTRVVITNDPRGEYKFALQTYAGRKLVLEQRSDSLAKLRSIGRAMLASGVVEEQLEAPAKPAPVEALTVSPVQVTEKVSAPRGRFEPTDADRQWANETSPYRNMDFDAVAMPRPIRGGSPAIDFPKRVRPMPAMGRQPNVMTDGPGISIGAYGGYDETTSAYASEGR